MTGSTQHPVMVRRPARLRGELRVPGDKSISHRALILNAIADGEAGVSNLCPGADVASTARCLRALGVAIEPDGDAGSLRVRGVGLEGLREPEQVLDAGNSGTTIRLLSGLLAGQPFFATITGDDSLRARPMGRIIKPLRLMGCDVWGRRGDTLPPLAIRGGGLKGIDYALPVASAQLKSALLLAALFAQGPTTVREPSPSRDHTERMLLAQGADLRVEGTSISLEPGRRLSPVDVQVPGDISAAAFWLVAAAIHPDAEIVVRGVGVNPGRTGVLDVLHAMGADLEVIPTGEQGGEPVADLVARSSELRGIEIGGSLVPRLIDEIPVLAVASAFARGESRFVDVGELRVKETDRLRALAVEMARMGASVAESADGLTVSGGGGLHGARCLSYKDHRMAMAMAVAGLAASGQTVIDDPGVAEISYPGFWADLRRVSEGELE
ncbi:MAG TPA: 3-phosphoshikimate 1-carboxyvinyltransferase [Chloroflexota bacterium]|nr:3-phosphoshikimate 1-carboxyvinyltransferase [Chloroflexota bacterium]